MREVGGWPAGELARDVRELSSVWRGLSVCLSVGLPSCPTAMRLPRARCDDGISYAPAGGVAAMAASRGATSYPWPGLVASMSVWASGTGRQGRVCGDVGASPRREETTAAGWQRRRARQSRYGDVCGGLWAMGAWEMEMVSQCVPGDSDSRVVRHATRCARRRGYWRAAKGSLAQAAGVL